MTASAYQDGIDYGVERERLREYRIHLDSLLPQTFWQSLRDKKSEASANCDQGTAKLLWCLETIGRIQDHFLSAFLSISKSDFMTAWNQLERCEIELSFLDRHYSEEDNEFGIEHIRVHSRQLQELYPYTWGLSPSLRH